MLKWEQQFGVVLHRIDEVLTELFDTYLALGERIVTIQDEVESGDMGTLLAQYFELLIDLEWIA